MRLPAPVARHHAIQLLEPRRLLSFAAFGTPTVVKPAGDELLAQDVAVAGNGSYVVASLRGAEDSNTNDGAQGFVDLWVSRFNSSGVQIGSPMKLDSVGNLLFMKFGV